MPQGDRKGPMGQGSRTGKKMGFCSGYENPRSISGFSNHRRGRRSGNGMTPGSGRKFGWGNTNEAIEPKQSIADEINLLQSQAATLKNLQLNLERKIEELQRNERKNVSD